MTSVSYSFAHLRGWAVLVLILLILAVLGGTLWRNVNRLENLREFAAYQHRIQRVAIDIQNTLSLFFNSDDRVLDAQRLSRLSAETADLSRQDRHVAPDTPENLAALSRSVAALARAGATTDEQQTLLLQALAVTNTMLDDENLQRERLVAEVGKRTRTEVTITLVTVASLLLMIVLFLRFRILHPLRDMEKLLLRLAREDFTPIETAGIDQLLLPVFDNYNLMVRQLAALKEVERGYAESLEAEVRAATSALLEQQASLARSERLAAVGELAAGIAHELRNPLAGIQMTCVNLRNDIEDPDQRERIELVVQELKRMGRLLNELLGQARHTPIPAADFNLSRMARELVALARYQVPPAIRVSFQGPEELMCRLPEPRLRQCLLNLILNAAEAVGREEGAIRIEARQDDGRIELTVTDSGPGFPAGLLLDGIRPFATGRVGGTGLGLAMVQRFVRDLGGQLSLANVEPHGASVRLSLPLRAG